MFCTQKSYGTFGLSEFEGIKVWRKNSSLMMTATATATMMTNAKRSVTRHFAVRGDGGDGGGEAAVVER